MKVELALKAKLLAVEKEVRDVVSRCVEEGNKNQRDVMGREAANETSTESFPLFLLADLLPTSTGFLHLIKLSLSGIRFDDLMESLTISGDASMETISTL